MVAGVESEVGRIGYVARLGLETFVGWPFRTIL
jgi:hypothetical protein